MPKPLVGSKRKYSEKIPINRIDNQKDGKEMKRIAKKLPASSKKPYFLIAIITPNGILKQIEKIIDHPAKEKVLGTRSNNS